MQVAEILREKGDKVVTAAPDSRLADVVQILQQENIGAVLVKADGDDILGVVSERDVVRSIARDGAITLEKPVSDVMTRSVITCSPHMETEALMEKMLSAHIRHLPVVENGALLGIISIGDVVKSVVTGLKLVRSALQDQLIASAVWSIDED